MTERVSCIQSAVRYWAHINLITHFHLESLSLKVEWGCCPFNLPSHDIWLRGDEENSCQLSLLQEEKILLCLVFLVAHASSYSCGCAPVSLCFLGISCCRCNSCSFLLWLLLVWIKAVLFSGLSSVLVGGMAVLAVLCWQGQQGQAAGVSSLQPWHTGSCFWLLPADNPQNHTTRVTFVKFHVFIIGIFNNWLEGIWIFQLLGIFCTVSFSPPLLFHWTGGNLLSDPVLLVVKLLPEYSHSVFLPTVRNKGRCSLLSLSFAG